MREMKDSGVPWIGEIPKGWKTMQLKYCADPSQENSFMDGDWIESPFIEETGIRYLTTGNIGDGTFKRQGDGHISLASFVALNCKYAYPGDLVIARLNAPYGRSCILPNDDDCYVLAVDIVIVRTKEDPRFICYVTQCDGYQKKVEDAARGTTMQRISRTNLGKIKVPTPSLAEQHRIADFLDAKCAEIDSILEKTKASIEDYRALKLSVVTEAVTKGIRGGRPMRDSGVEWIGEIPAEWDVLSFYRSNYIRGRLGWKGLKAEEYVPEGYPFLSAFNIIENHLDWSELNYITKERYDESPEIKLSIGDLLIVKDGAGIGKCARIDDMPLGDATVNSSLAVITASERFDYRYEYYYMQSAPFQHVIWFLKIGMGVPHLTQEKMREISIPCPTLDEQQEIAAYLDEKCAAIDSLIASKEALIAELEAYKKSIIYEYVTGKKEVI